MKIGYVKLPTPDNSKILGLPIAPADNMTSFPTRTSRVCPSGVLNSIPRALRSGDESCEGDGERRSHMIRVTVEFVKTLKLGRSS